ncbi:MAG: NUDIX domain-containing protein [Alicyclobacillaceae bacterium]|jgi:8-oxo-dGTP diphosphatase|uniref:NUDIX domain-containing protein n=1 Tax=Alicyclobacillus sp. SP_1 TaxID=2942475 RepID=UPI00215752B1|nr:NUDIX domain-containing protein [Alicyclobacillus sp. SP_1]MCY0887613.1 NUDIX domain-containing protein [Alicyclobacillaceae bacterium]
MWCPATELHVRPNSPVACRPSAILVCAWLGDGWLWVRHPSRGWELPGGKLEPGETVEMAVHREVFEETGARVSHLAWVGEYRYLRGDADWAWKWIYEAVVDDVGARPPSSEMIAVARFLPIPTPTEVQGREDVSFVVKDSVYATLYNVLYATRHRAESRSELQL